MFARIGRLVRGFMSLFISGIEESNPEALIAAAPDVVLGGGSTGGEEGKGRACDARGRKGP